MTISEFIDKALEEDIREGDHSSLSSIPESAKGKARLLIKEDGVLAGVDLAKQIFAKVDDSLEIDVLLPDGSEVKYGDIGLYVSGSSRNILTAERLVLNMMQRMSGIATLTNKFVKAVEGTNAKILDTRKTTPNLRQFEKWAVKIGGGHNHRFGLYDMIMLKDNHIDYCGGIAQAIKAANDYLVKKDLNIKIEIETRNLNEVQQVLDTGGVDRIMLDNFTPELMTEAVKLIDNRYETEASGGITLETVRPYAETGVDYISVGALTHSAGSMDISLKAVK